MALISHTRTHTHTLPRSLAPAAADDLFRLVFFVCSVCRRRASGRDSSPGRSRIFLTSASPLTAQPRWSRKKEGDPKRLRWFRRGREWPQSWDTRSNRRTPSKRCRTTSGTPSKPAQPMWTKRRRESKRRPQRLSSSSAATGRRWTLSSNPRTSTWLDQG